MSLINLIRIYIAELLLGLVVRVAPKDEEGMKLIRVIYEYVKEKIKENESIRKKGF